MNVEQGTWFDKQAQKTGERTCESDEIWSNNFFDTRCLTLDTIDHEDSNLIELPVSK